MQCTYSDFRDCELLVTEARQRAHIPRPTHLQYVHIVSKLHVHRENKVACTWANACPSEGWYTVT